MRIRYGTSSPKCPKCGHNMTWFLGRWVCSVDRKHTQDKAQRDA